MTYFELINPPKFVVVLDWNIFLELLCVSATFTSPTIGLAQSTEEPVIQNMNCVLCAPYYI